MAKDLDISSYEEARDLKQVLFRLPEKDRDELLKLVAQDGFKLQWIFSAFVDAYMARNPETLKMIRDWRDRNVITKTLRLDKFVFTDREKKKILDDLTRSSSSVFSKKKNDE